MKRYAWLSPLNAWPLTILFHGWHRHALCFSVSSITCTSCAANSLPPMTNSSTGQPFTWDPQRRKDFDAALAGAEKLAQERLKQSKDDPRALFALTLVTGFRADDAALIAKKKFSALSYTKSANGYAERLLARLPIITMPTLPLAWANTLLEARLLRSAGCCAWADSKAIRNKA